MIINEKQIKDLMNICLEYFAFLALLDSKPSKQEEILNLIDEITTQSEESKVAE